MTTYRGSCLCGNVTYEVTGSFDSLYLCHCKYCQKDTGSAHAANLFSSSAQLTLLSGEESLQQFNLTDTRHSKCFCRNCGSAMPWQVPGMFVIVPAGSLDTTVDVEAIPTTAHLFLASQADWEQNSANAPRFNKFPE